METIASYTGPFAFFRKHFNGDYSLGRSYWVNTFLIQLFAPVLGVVLLPWLDENFPARYGSATVILLTAIGTVAWAWAISGTWSSAAKHVSRGGRQGWATAAKAMIVIGVLRMAGQLLGSSPALAEHWKVATGWQLGPAVTFQVRADGKSLLLKGGINDGTAEALEQALAGAPSVRTLVLDSSGGWVRQGTKIANVIAAHGLDTYVEQECSSACTIAFLAGKQRAGEPNARIGFHAFRSIGGDAGSANNGVASTARATYGLAGLSPAFISKVVSTPQSKMWYPLHSELLAEGVFTRESLGGENARFATNAATRENVATDFVKVPAFQALSVKYPEEYKALIDKAWAQLQAKRPDGEVMAVARGHITELTGRLIPIVDDQTLVDFNKLVADQAEALGKRSPAACIEMLFPTGQAINMAGLIPPDLGAREQEVLTNMIRTSDPRNSRHFSKPEKDEVTRRLLGTLTQDQIQLLVSAELRLKLPAEGCRAVTAYLNAMNAIPDGQRARAIRAIYSE